VVNSERGRHDEAVGKMIIGVNEVGVGILMNLGTEWLVRTKGPRWLRDAEM
jgi:hypothetical protein